MSTGASSRGESGTPGQLISRDISYATLLGLSGVASPHGETVCVGVASPHWKHVGTLSSMTQGPQANKDTSGSHRSPRVQRGPPRNRASAPHTSGRATFFALQYLFNIPDDPSLQASLGATTG